MRKSYAKVLEEYCEIAGEYEDDINALKMMEISRLDRIAGALEGINDSLEKISNSVELLEKLSDCVSEREYGGFFSVSGSITADIR